MSAIIREAIVAVIMHALRAAADQGVQTLDLVNWQNDNVRLSLVSKE